MAEKVSLSRKASEVLQVLAQECDGDPRARRRGVDERVLGDRVGAYLGIVIHQVDELVDKGLAEKNGKRVVLSERGYRLARPRSRPRRRRVDARVVVLSLASMALGGAATALALGLLGLLG